MASVGLFLFLEFHLWADSYKILNYGSPQRLGYRQIDSCGFDAIKQHWYTNDDYIENNNVGLDLYLDLAGEPEWLNGASFYLEADGYNWEPRQMPGDTSFFDTDTLPGADWPDDEAHNGYARRAVEGEHSAGYILANLRGRRDPEWDDPESSYEYNKWFSKTRMWCGDSGGVDSMSYHPRFRVRTDSEADSIELFLEVHVLFSTSDGFTTNKDSLWAADTVGLADFDSLGKYQYFDVPYQKTWSNKEAGPSKDTIAARSDYRAWWNGKDEVWIDRVDVYDKWAYECLFEHQYDYSCSLYVAWQNNQYLKGYYVNDEPRPWQINVQKYWHNFLDDRFPEKHVFTSWAKVFNYWLDYYLTNNEAPWHLVNYYIVNDHNTDTLSETCYSDSCRTLQGAIDTLLNYLDKHREIAQEYGKELGYNIPLTEYWNRDGLLRLRYPTQWEQEAWIWLPLTHGVDVTSYWTYDSWYTNCDDPEATYKCPGDTTAPWFFYHDGDLWNAYVRSLAYRDPDTSVPPEERNWKHYEPHWSVVRRVNTQLHKIGNVLSDRSSWKAGFRCDNLGSWVSSFKSDSYTNDKAYVEIATFEHSNIDYLLLVNRRCLSTEAQGVRVELDLPGDQYYIIGLDSIVTEDSVYFAFIDTTYSDELNGKIPFSTYLAPGQGKFFKIVVAARKS